VVREFKEKPNVDQGRSRGGGWERLVLEGIVGGGVFDGVVFEDVVGFLSGLLLILVVDVVVCEVVGDARDCEIVSKSKMIDIVVLIVRILCVLVRVVCVVSFECILWTGDCC
jgi:hypothetical protein